MSSLSKDQLKQLYSSGYSMMEISSILKCTPSKVIYWMKKYNINRRNPSQASYVKQNPDGDPFEIKKSLNQEEEKLFALGLGIYMGEGNKASKHAVSVGNTDPLILNIFLNFLKKICQVEDHKIHYSIICFNNTPVSLAQKYWNRKLKTHPTNFGKIVQVPPQGKGTYRKKSSYGVCSVWITNIKLKKWLMNEIDKLARVV